MKVFRFILIVSICLIFIYGSETEIVSKRTFTSKTYSVGNGQLKQVVYPEPIHYLSGSTYLPIPAGEDADYYRNLALDQMKKTTNASKSNNFLMSTASTGSPTLGKLGIENVGGTTYNPYYDYPFYLGKLHNGSSWCKYRVFNHWNFGSLNSDYEIDSTIYEVTMPAGVIESGNLTIQWMFASWDYVGDGLDDQYDAIGDGVQFGTITIDNGFSSSRTKTIKWNAGSGLSDSLQSMFDNGYSTNFYSGLKTNRESTDATNWVQINNQNIIVYYHPPKKTITVDNTIYNTSASIGGELEIISGTLPPETNSTNDAGDDIVLYEDSTYTISEPEDQITYNSVDYTHHSWKENTNDYELDHDFEVDYELEDQVGWFEELENVTISKSYGDGSIWIKDPWWKDPATGARHNPPVYKTFAGNSYSVFLDQNSQFQSNVPGYTLKAQKYVGKSDGIYEFSGWSASPSGDASFESSTSRITKVCFDDAGVTITANYNRAS